MNAISRTLVTACFATAAAAQQPGGAPKKPRGNEGTPIASATTANSAAEQKTLAVINDIDANKRKGALLSPTDDGRLLRVLVESMGAKTAVELGTSTGYTALWMCLGLRGSGGHLTTYEMDPGRAAQARENFRQAGVDDLVTLVEGDAHKQVASFSGTIDFVFIDADKAGYIDYLNKLLPLVRPGGLIVAHNMTPRMADPSYVSAITTNAALETVFINKEGSGIGLTLKKR